MTPGLAHFWPQGHNLNKVGKGLLDDASYQIFRLSRPCGFRQEDFFMFPNISLCKTRDPPGQAHFGPQGYNVNNFGKGPLDDLTYQISRL